MITASQATPSRQSESKHFAGTHWAIDSHYQLLKRLGCGVQGVVVSALDLRGCGSPVAIKKVDTPQLKEEARRVLREIRLMRCLTHPNVLRLLDVMISDDTSSSLSPQRTGDGATQPAGDELDYSSTTTAASSKPHRRRATFREVYIVTELMSTDLRRILSIANQPASTFELRAEQVQYLLYQLLCGVHYIGSAGVLHRDLKPSNLLIDLRTCQLRICDFGLARALPLCDNDQAATTIDDDTESDSATMTEYVVTRHYRAPELLLGVRYGVGVDAWSVGCVLAELLAPRSGVLFKGTERRTMLACIAQLVGRPDDQHLGFVTNPHARQFLLSIPTQPTTSLRLHLAKFRWSGCEISTSALDLLEGLLQFSPARRLNAEKCLDHPYLDWAKSRVGVGTSALQRPATRRISMADVESCDTTVASIRDLLADEATKVRRPSRQSPSHYPLSLNSRHVEPRTAAIIPSRP